MHTKGPWRVSKGKARRVTSEHGVIICNAVLRNQGGPKHKANLKDEHEAEANADLIAAAPCLLKPAPDAADLLDQYANYVRREVRADDLERHPYLPLIEETAADLRAAIAKATGAGA